MKVTLSLTPRQVARLRELAMQQRGFPAGRVDLSEAVRELLDRPEVAHLLEGAHAAFMARLKDLVKTHHTMPEATWLLTEIGRPEEAPSRPPPAPLVTPALDAAIAARREAVKEAAERQAVKAAARKPRRRTRR